jgi:hypothetical protein
MHPQPNRPTRAAWFSFDDDERRDAERVAELEETARERADLDIAKRMRLLNEAEELRRKWDQHKSRYTSLDEIFDVFESIARESRTVDRSDPEALGDLASRAQDAGMPLENFADELPGTEGGE